METTKSSRTSGPDSSPLIVACQALRPTEINMLGPPVTQCCKRCDRRIPGHRSRSRHAMRYDDIVTLLVSWQSRKFTLSIVDDVSEPTGLTGLKYISFLLFECVHPVLCARQSSKRSRCTNNPSSCTRNKEQTNSLSNLLRLCYFKRF